MIILLDSFQNGMRSEFKGGNNYSFVAFGLEWYDEENIDKAGKGKMNDYYIDALLNIQTGEGKGFTHNFHYHRYEPTPYHGLDELFQAYQLQPTDEVVDFGCGKGRFPFYVHYLFQTKVTGVEMDPKLIQIALENKVGYVEKRKRAVQDIKFFHGIAEEYPIKPTENKFYFFNPFTVQIFMKVVQNILKSVEEVKREVDIILYYPSRDYIYYLENQTAFTMIKEVPISGDFERNENERFLVYRL